MHSYITGTCSAALLAGHLGGFGIHELGGKGGCGNGGEGGGGLGGMGGPAGGGSGGCGCGCGDGGGGLQQQVMGTPATGSVHCSKVAEAQCALPLFWVKLSASGDKADESARTRWSRL